MLELNPVITKPVRVLIADKSVIYLNALENLLNTRQNVHLMGVCYSLNKLKETLKSIDIDVLLIDVIIFNKNYIDAIKELKNHYPSIRIITMTIQEGENIRVEMITAGAHEHISKWDNTLKLLNVINCN